MTISTVSPKMSMTWSLERTPNWRERWFLRVRPGPPRFRPPRHGRARFSLLGPSRLLAGLAVLWDQFGRRRPVGVAPQGRPRTHRRTAPPRQGHEVVGQGLLPPLDASLLRGGRRGRAPPPAAAPRPPPPRR